MYTTTLRGAKPKRIITNSSKAIIAIARAYIEDNRLGVETFQPATIFRDGKPWAILYYNGRVHNLNGLRRLAQKILNGVQ